jgi:CO/xanthine dehydrogenase FAD-binding subunit
MVASRHSSFKRSTDADMTYLLPTSVESALASLAGGDSTIVAGATDYYPAQVGAPAPDGQPGGVVDITRLDDLRTISRDHDGWRIGALTTWTDIIRSDLPAAFDGLRAAATQIGGVQIQNVATLAGNLCNASPAADGVPPLLALDARVEVRSARTTRVLNLGDFILGNRVTARRPDELVTAVLVPDVPDRWVGSFEKLGARAYLNISIVMVAALADIDAAGTIKSARIAVGACSPVARRLTTLERDLGGASIDDVLETAAAPEHLAVLSPIDDVRATADYRSAMVPVLVARALRACGGGDR